MNGAHVAQTESGQNGRRRHVDAVPINPEDATPPNPQWMGALQLLEAIIRGPHWPDTTSYAATVPINRPEVWRPLLGYLYLGSTHRAAMLAATGQLLRTVDNFGKERVLIAWSQVLMFGGDRGLECMSQLLVEAANKRNRLLWSFTGNLLDCGLLCQTDEGRSATRAVVLRVLTGSPPAGPAHQRRLFDLVLDRLRLPLGDARHAVYRDLLDRTLSVAGERFTAASADHAPRAPKWHWIEELAPASHEQRAILLVTTALSAPDRSMRTRARDRLDGMVASYDEGPRRAALQALRESDFLVRSSRVAAAPEAMLPLDAPGEFEPSGVCESPGWQPRETDPGRSRY